MTVLLVTVLYIAIFALIIYIIRNVLRGKRFSTADALATLAILIGIVLAQQTVINQSPNVALVSPTQDVDVTSLPPITAMTSIESTSTHTTKPTVTTTSAVEAAEQVRACILQHGLPQAYTVKRPEENSIYYEQSAPYYQVARCDWPPPPYAGLDGYSEITVFQRAGLGTSNAELNMSYVIKASCPIVSVSLSFQKFRATQRFPPFTAKRSTIVDRSGDIFDTGPEANRLPFYPERNDIVVLVSGGTGLDEVSCISAGI